MACGIDEGAWPVVLMRGRGVWYPWRGVACGIDVGALFVVLIRERGL